MASTAYFHATQDTLGNHRLSHNDTGRGLIVCKIAQLAREAEIGTDHNPGDAIGCKGYMSNRDQLLAST
jgi:hypothetical protein